jgi:hypothetical protein
MLLAATLGCFLQSGVPVSAQTPASARVSFLHLSADAPSLDVYIDGSRVVSGLQFSQTSAYFGVTATSHRIQVTEAGHIDSLVNSTVTFDAGRSYTWVLSGVISAADLNVPVSPDLQISRFIQLSDNAGDPADPRPRIRVVNASPGAGALDIRTDSPSALTLATSLGYGGVSAYANVASGTYSISVYLAGTTSLQATVPNVTLQERPAYTIVFGGVLPPAIASDAPNPVQAFQPVKLTDQNSLGSATLTQGCNLVVVKFPVGTPVLAIVGRIDQPGLVTAVWRFDNASKSLRAGYFGDHAAPLDFTQTVLSPEALFICVSTGTTWSPPA